MPNSKQAHSRYNILDIFFKRRQNPMTFHEFLEEVNSKIEEIYSGESIKIRTLQRDIALYRDKKNGFSAPLSTQNNMGKELYCNSDTNFSFAKKRLLSNDQYCNGCFGKVAQSNT
jgi:hypothetical protein